MSHFTTVKTVIRDKETLTDTLRQMHYQFQEGEHVPIRGYEEQNAYGQVVIDTGCDYDIGFQRQGDEPFSLCADWWGVEGNSSIKENSFVQSLNREYSRIAIKKQVAEQGFIVESEHVMENGEIEIVVCEPL